VCRLQYGLDKGEGAEQWPPGMPWLSNYPQRCHLGVHGMRLGSVSVTYVHPGSPTGPGDGSTSLMMVLLCCGCAAEALDEALLPQPTHKLTAQPCHAAYQAAKSTALLSQVLLQLAAQKPVLMDEQQGSSSSVDEDLLESKHIQDRYSALVCQPYALTCNESERYQELLPPWERLKRPAPRQRFKWLEELPPDMSSEKEEFLRRDCPRSNV